MNLKNILIDQVFKQLSCRQLSPGTHDIYRGVVSYHMAATELIHFLALFIHSAREDGPVVVFFFFFFTLRL